MTGIGIIGCGSIARNRHIPAYRKNPNAEIAAYYDPVFERAEELANLYGGKAYLTLEELLSDERVDAVSVCTPEAYHEEPVCMALAAGRHVLCEKPMALDSSQAERMKKTADESGRMLMISYNQRIYEPHWKMKELIEQGTIGKVLSFRTFLSNAGPEYVVYGADMGKPDSTYFDHSRNGGVLLSVGCHRIDLIPYLLGKDIVSVFAETMTLDKRKSDGSLIEEEDTAMILMRCEDGVPGMLYTSWCAYGCVDRRTEIFGTAGTIKAFEEPYSVSVYRKNGEKVFYDLSAFEKQGSGSGTAVVDRFVECLNERKEPFITAEDGLKSMYVLEAVKESARRKQWVAIKKSR